MAGIADTAPRKPRQGSAPSIALLLGWALAFVASAQSPFPFAPVESALPIQQIPLGFGDVNGDGAVDLIVSGAPFVWINDGHGRFAAAVGATGYGGPAPLQSRIADVNSDGRADLVVVTASGAALWLGTASGSLLLATTPPGFGANAASLAIGDVNGDGAPDIVFGTVVANPNPFPTTLPGPTNVWINLGLATFASAGSLGLPNLGSAALALVDFDQDGDLDLLTGLGGFVPNLNGTFGAPVNLQAVTGGASTILIAHLNTDSYPDAVTTYFGAAQLWIGGPGGLTALGPPLPNAFPFDVTGDGKDEILETVFPNTLSVIPVGPTGIANSSILMFLRTQGGVLMAADLDGDGDRDLVVFDGGPSIWLADGVGGLHYDGPAVVPMTLLGGPVVADVDQDGSPDLVGTIFDGYIPRVAVAQNDGVGRFTWTLPAWLAPAIANTGSVVAANDINGDGFPDLVVFELTPNGSNFNIGMRTVVNNAGAGWTPSPTTFVTAGGPDAAAVSVDLNADGVDEVVLVDGSSTARVFEVVGGALSPTPTVIANGLFHAIAVGDVNGDGLPDVALAGAVSLLLINNGGGVFTPDPAFPTQPARYVNLCDVNGDGVLDCYLNTSLYAHLGANWPHVSDVPTGVSPLFGPFSALSFDFEGDGDLDTIVGSGRMYVTESPGVTTTWSGTIPSGVNFAAVDLDHDGDLDLVGTWPPQLPGTAPGRSEVVRLNRSRQLTLDAPLRPGRPTHFGLHGAPGGSYLLFGAPGLASLTVPPYGTVLLNPTSALLLDAGPLDATGSADFSIPLPLSLSAYLGVEFDFQGVVDTSGGPRLTNARRAVISGY